MYNLQLRVPRKLRFIRKGSTDIENLKPISLDAHKIR
jgi:hypothetical protein